MEKERHGRLRKIGGYQGSEGGKDRTKWISRTDIVDFGDLWYNQIRGHKAVDLCLLISGPKVRVLHDPFTFHLTPLDNR